jgi:hypothetical protein
MTANEKPISDSRKTVTWGAVILVGHIINIPLLIGWIVFGLSIGAPTHPYALTLETWQSFLLFSSVWIAVVFLISAILTLAIFRLSRHAWLGWLIGTVIGVGLEFAILIGMM